MGQLLFVGIVLVVITGLHYYLWRRLVRDTTRPGRARRIGTWVAIGLVVLLMAAFIGSRVLPHTASVILAWPGFLWLAVMFYLLVGLVLLEIPALIARVVLRRRVAAPVAVAVAVGPDPIGTDLPAHPSEESQPSEQSRRLFLGRAVALTAGVAAVGLVGSGVSTALGDPVLKQLRIPLRRLPRTADGFKIALVSDIHLGPLNGIDRTRRIVEQINGMNADLVAVVGDLVDGSVAELGPAAAPLAGLRSRLGTYFVTGNHEYFSGYDEWIDEVQRLGMRPLRNASVELPNGLDLAGVNDVTGRGFGDGPDMQRAVGNRDRSRPVVLLAHQPVQARDAAPFGVDLQLSGHTHGGQMRPFDLIVRASGQPLVSGLGEVDGMPVYVTNGAGFWGPPVRVGASPDVTLITLTKA